MTLIAFNPTAAAGVVSARTHRITTLLAEARSEAQSHVTATATSAQLLAADLTEFKDMGDAIPPGVRDEATKLAATILEVTARIQSIMGRAA